MLVTLLGMIVLLQPDIRTLEDVFMMALQSLRESYLKLFASTLINLRPVQPVKASSPILITFLGIAMDSKDLQSENAYLSMLVTLLGMVTEMRPEQP